MEKLPMCRQGLKERYREGERERGRERGKREREVSICKRSIRKGKCEFCLRKDDTLRTLDA